MRGGVLRGHIVCGSCTDISSACSVFVSCVPHCFGLFQHIAEPAATESVTDMSTTASLVLGTAWAVHVHIGFADASEFGLHAFICLGGT